MKPESKVSAKLLAVASALALCIAVTGAPLCAAGPCTSISRPASSSEECHRSSTGDDAAQFISAACKNCAVADLPAAVMNFAKENHLLSSTKQSFSSTSSELAAGACLARIPHADASQRFTPIDSLALPASFPPVIALRI